MSNDLIGLGGAKPAQAFQNMGAPESLAEGIGSSYGIIGYKGKTWSLRLRGDRKNFVRPDDGSPASYIDVIILRQAKTKSKSYYEAYDQDNESKRPVCSSLDSVVPDADIPNPQSNACAICPRNKWKLNAEGRNTRECNDYKRLAVLLTPSQTQQMFGKPLMEPVFLRVPAASLNDLAVFGETMAGQGWHYASFVTRISFDPDAAHPKMRFKAVQALSEAEASVVVPLLSDPISLRVTGESENHSAPRLAAPAPLQQLAAPAATAAQPVAAPSVMAPVLDLKANNAPIQPAAPTALGLTAAPTASPSSPAPAPSMFVAAPPPAPVAPVAAAPAQNTVADTGEVTMSDAALDAQLKALMAQ